MHVLLVKSISFRDFDRKLITIPVNTEVYIDLTESIAFYNNIHFYIDKSEYLTMN